MSPYDPPAIGASRGGGRSAPRPSGHGATRRRPAAPHREGGRAEDLAYNRLEGRGREIGRGGLELHALIGRPYEGLRTLGGHFGSIFERPPARRSVGIENILTPRIGALYLLMPEQRSGAYTSGAAIEASKSETLDIIGQPRRPSRAHGLPTIFHGLLRTSDQAQPSQRCANHQRASVAAKAGSAAEREQQSAAA